MEKSNIFYVFPGKFSCLIRERITVTKGIPREQGAECEKNRFNPEPWIGLSCKDAIDTCLGRFIDQLVMVTKGIRWNSYGQPYRPVPVTLYQVIRYNAT
jgi:hypothetical protein